MMETRAADGRHHEAGEFIVTVLLFTHTHAHARTHSLSLPQQFLTFALLLVSACTCASNRCYFEHELSEAANRKLRSHYPQPAEPSPAAAAGSSYTCPVRLYQQQLPPHLSGRSLSPWRYV